MFTLNNYWILLLWIFLGGFILYVVFPQKPEIVLGKIEHRWSYPGAIILVAPLILWAGFRGDSIGDTASYRSLFLGAPSRIAEWGDYLSELDKDQGFSAFMVFVKAIIGEHDAIFFLIVAAIQLLCVALLYRKYSCNYWLSIFIFIGTTDYIAWMYNGMRQFIAAALIFAAMGLLAKKRFIAVIIVILIASTFHMSALLMLPVIFIMQGKAWNWRTILFVLLCVAAIFFVDQFTDILDKALSDTQYSSVVSDWEEGGDDGTNPLRVLVYSVPTILSLFGIRYVREENDPMINLAVNAGIVSTAIYLVSMVTSGVYMGRLPIYVSLMSNGIALPWLINHMFSRQTARMVQVIAVIGYCLFFYYQMHVSWGAL